MMANLVTNSEQKGVIATKIAKVNEEVSVLVQLEIHVCMTTKYLLALGPINGFPMGSIKVSSSYDNTVQNLYSVQHLQANSYKQ